jgi:arginine-tRNA-protein transferase
MRLRAVETVVYDQAEACPYLPARTARLPLRMPADHLEGASFDQRLEQGDRRTGPFLYTTKCPGCQACESIRLDVAKFTPSRTQGRVHKRGRHLFRSVVQEPIVDAQRVELFNRHRRQRDLAHDRIEIDEFGYQQFLLDTCCDTVEVAHYLDDELVMVAIVDVGQTSMSAVYTYYDDCAARHSPGVYSVLFEIDLCRQWRRKWLYLGYYVAGSRHMSYKATYRPHERRVAGHWRQF